MREGDKQGGNRPDIPPEELKQHTSKILEEIQGIRDSMDSLKQNMSGSGDEKATVAGETSSAGSIKPAKKQVDAPSSVTPKFGVPVA